jgi:hypothetical protein
MSSTVFYLTTLLNNYKEAAMKCRVDLAIFETAIASLEQQLQAAATVPAATTVQEEETTSQITEETNTEPQTNNPKPKKNKKEKEAKRIFKWEGKVIRLKSEEEITRIIGDIDEGRLSSKTKAGKWKTKHYPKAAYTALMLQVIRDTPGRAASFDEIEPRMRALDNDTATKNKTYEVKDFLRELRNQGIIEVV